MSFRAGDTLFSIFTLSATDTACANVPYYARTAMAVRHFRDRRRVRPDAAVSVTMEDLRRAGELLVRWRRAKLSNMCTTPVTAARACRRAPTKYLSLAGECRSAPRVDSPATGVSGIRRTRDVFVGFSDFR